MLPVAEGLGKKKVSVLPPKPAAFLPKPYTALRHSGGSATSSGPNLSHPLTFPILREAPSTSQEPTGEVGRKERSGTTQTSHPPCPHKTSLRSGIIFCPSATQPSIRRRGEPVPKEVLSPVVLDQLTSGRCSASPSRCQPKAWPPATSI